ncbi:MAG: MBL fold metallo-hydrolase [Clostridiales bacterium]|jgi:phosphoribosyl 1,2-cyclic phosphodiesterase|nr:MBL fold metallo-hydrolase [Clostridiales bacterium]
MEITSLSSGSSGNCILVSHNETNILVDCGRSGKHIDSCLGEVGLTGKDIDYILITHEHNDHISGVGVYSRKYNLPIYSTVGTFSYINMHNKLGKIAPDNIHTFDYGQELKLGGVHVIPFKTPHDATQPACYRFIADGKSAVVATDIGYLSDSVCEHLLDGADIAFIEANHDINMLKNGDYPYFLKDRILGDKGHLPNEKSAEIAVKMIKKGTKHIMLGHLSTENNLPKLAYETVKNALENAGATVGDDVLLDVANRNEPSKRMIA